jgi:pimeloyl-ACP methyl ester carboxylesterase
MTFDSSPTLMIDVKGTPFAYREAGTKRGVPLVLLHHLTAVLDDWDPKLIDGLASERHLIAFDNRGIGRSGGTTPRSVEAMAEDAVSFVRALGHDRVDLLGFSLGGFVAQVMALDAPTLIRKIIIAGSSPAGGEGISDMGSVLQDGVARATSSGRHPKHFLFFSQTTNGQAAANAFLERLNARTQDRDAAISNESIHAQLAAIHAWAQADPSRLGEIRHPVFVANGDDDLMAPTINSFSLARRLSDAQLSIFPDAGHGGIFQHHQQFAQQALQFLR